MPTLAVAQAFSWEASAKLRQDFDSNPALQAASSDSSSQTQATASLGLQRQSDAGRTQLNLELVGNASTRRGDASTQGRLALQHNLSAPRDSWSFSAGYRRDRTLDNQPRASDVALGNTARQTTDASASWAHNLSERLTAQAQLQATESRVDQAPQGSNYVLGTGSLGLQHSRSETSNLSANLSRTRQQRSGEAGTVTIDSLRLGWNQSVTERLRWGSSVARSQTTREAPVTRLVCPVLASFCDSGLVQRVPFTETFRRQTRDNQFSADVSWRWSPLGDVSLKASRALSPGAFGVTREDALGLTASAAWSEDLRWAAGWDLSRSLRPLAAASTADSQSSLNTLSLSLSQRLAERWQLEAQVQNRVYDASVPQIRARSNRFSITLQYVGPTVPGFR